MKDFIEKAMEWNKQCFGNIFMRKKNPIARLAGILFAGAMETHSTKALRRLEIKV